MYDRPVKTTDSSVCWPFVIALQRLPAARHSIPASLSDSTVHNNDGKRQLRVPLSLTCCLSGFAVPFDRVILLALTALPSATTRWVTGLSEMVADSSLLELTCNGSIVNATASYM